jgi:hypothetical protein
MYQIAYYVDTQHIHDMNYRYCYALLVVIAPFASTQRSEGRITGLSDMTLKTEVACRSRCGT